MEIRYNACGWGPVLKDGEVLDIPYSTFSRIEKFGKMADCQADTRRSGSKGNVYSPFAYYHNTDDSGGVFINQIEPTVKAAYTNRKSTYVQKGKHVARDNKGAQLSGMTMHKRKNWNDNQRMQRQRDIHAIIAPYSSLVSDILYSAVKNSRGCSYTISNLIDAEYTCKYNREYDTINTKNTVKLSKKARIPKKADVFSNINMMDHIDYLLGNDGKTVFYANSGVISMLMTCIKSQFPWDLLITKKGNKIHIQGRGDVFLFQNYVLENAAEVPFDAEKDSVSHIVKVTDEAANVCYSFIRQVIVGDDSDNKAESFGGGGIVYKKIDFDGSNFVVVCRGEIDATESNGTNMIIRTLTEHFTKSRAESWIQNIDHQKGSITAKEITNNLNKVTQWVYQGILSGSEVMRVGFVCRDNSADNKNHSILCVLRYTLDEISKMVSVTDTADGFYVLKLLLKWISKLEDDGSYVLLNDPGKHSLKIYRERTDPPK